VVWPFLIAQTVSQNNDQNKTDSNPDLRGPIGTQSAASIKPPIVGPAESNTAAAAGAFVKGLGPIANVTASAAVMPRIPFSHVRDQDLQFIQVSLRNDSQQVAVVNGDATQASVGDKTTPAVGGGYVVQSAKPELTGKKHAAVIAVGLGTVGLAGPQFYEYITPDQHRDRSLGEAIGVDGTRHRVEAQRFGVRVLMPGDETVGWMAFACDPGTNVKTVTIPLSFSRSLTPDGVVEVPVRLDANYAAGFQPQNESANQKAAQEALQNAQKSAANSGAPRRVKGEESMLQDSNLMGNPNQPPSGTTATTNPNINGATTAEPSPGSSPNIAPAPNPTVSPK
jgi:hypothetical protein